MEFEDQQQDIFLLIERLKSMAKQRLEARLPFSPWALWMSSEGELGVTELMGAGEDDWPALVDILRARRDRMRAAAVVVLMGDEAGISVMRFECEHRDGAAVAVATPWRREGSEVRLLGSQFVEGGPGIWAA